VSTSIDKNSKLIQPRKLHGSQFGVFCPAETPEGLPVGIVPALGALMQDCGDRRPHFRGHARDRLRFIEFDPVARIPAGGCVVKINYMVGFHH
jgi:hypothetical protein